MFWNEIFQLVFFIVGIILIVTACLYDGYSFTWEFQHENFFSLITDEWPYLVGGMYCVLFGLSNSRFKKVCHDVLNQVILGMTNKNSIGRYGIIYFIINLS